MKLTRNTTPDGRGKYALVRLDKIRDLPRGYIEERAAKALDDLAAFGFLEYGEKGSEEEFFVVKLKDKNAPSALHAYASVAWFHGDSELSVEVKELANRSSKHPSRKIPD